MDELKARCAKSCPLSPLSFLQRAALVYGDSPSLIYNASTYTWSQTHSRCLRAASAIASMALGRGAVVSVVAPNIPAMYELQFAVPMAGCVLNNINTRLDARSISLILRHSESKAVFVDDHLRSLLLQSLSLLPPDAPRPILILIADDPLKSDPFLDYEDMLQSGSADFQWVAPASEWDPMTLNYTSGTTSSPKGVVHTPQPQIRLRNHIRLPDELVRPEAAGLPLDAADVPLQQVELHLGHGGGGRNQHLPPPLRRRGGGGCR